MCPMCIGLASDLVESDMIAGEPGETKQDPAYEYY